MRTPSRNWLTAMPLLVEFCSIEDMGSYFSLQSKDSDVIFCQLCNFPGIAETERITRKEQNCGDTKFWMQWNRTGFDWRRVCTFQRDCQPPRKLLKCPSLLQLSNSAEIKVLYLYRCHLVSFFGA
eukprot:g72978.t1